jgi:hypothetical protein
LLIFSSFLSQQKQLTKKITDSKGGRKISSN